METEVIEGAKDTITQCLPVLFLENNRSDRSPQLLTLLESLNYKCFWHISGYFNPRNFRRNPENVFQKFLPEANVLCFPPGAKLTIIGIEPVLGADDDWQKGLARIRHKARQV